MENKYTIHTYGFHGDRFNLENQYTIHTYGFYEDPNILDSLETPNKIIININSKITELCQMNIYKDLSSVKAVA